MCFLYCKNLLTRDIFVILLISHSPLICIWFLIIELYWLYQSDTASVKVPELELELASGTLGGVVTTVEGLITKISESECNFPHLLPHIIILLLLFLHYPYHYDFVLYFAIYWWNWDNCCDHAIILRPKLIEYFTFRMAEKIHVN